MVNDIVGKINAEDEANYRMRKEKQAATARMVKTFEEQRQRELEAARQAAKAEEERIREYNRAMDARSEGVAAKKQAKKDEEDRILKQIGNKSALGHWSANIGSRASCCARGPRPGPRFRLCLVLGPDLAARGAWPNLRLEGFRLSERAC